MRLFIHFLLEIIHIYWNSMASVLLDLWRGRARLISDRQKGQVGKFLPVCMRNRSLAHLLIHPCCGSYYDSGCCVYVSCYLCLTHCDPMDYSPLGSSVHGISQTGILEWVAISFSRGSSWPRDWTPVFCIASLPSEVLGKPHSSMLLNCNF